jgi:excisionase family DNA binding protein
MRVSTEAHRNVTLRGYSIRDVCESFGLSKGFVTREIKHGKLNARRLGRRLVVLEEDLRLYLEHANTNANKLKEASK